MTEIRGKPGEIPRKLSDEIVRRLQKARIGQTVVAQAKRRITQGRDSTMVYPDLWDHPKSFRQGGQPLLDTRNTIYNHLNAQEIIGDNEIRITLRSGGPAPEVALYHQNGFSTKGPNFIPLTIKARRNATKFAPLMRKRSAIIKEQKRASKTKGSNKAHFLQRLRSIDTEIERAGFIEGETYIMAWKGVTVPQRKIFNLPPEDVAEIQRAVKKALT